jgi:hypothetical protein
MQLKGVRLPDWVGIVAAVILILLAWLIPIRTDPTQDCRGPSPYASDC